MHYIGSVDKNVDTEPTQECVKMVQKKKKKPTADTHPEHWLLGTTLQSLFLDSEEETLHNFWPVFTGERYKFRHRREHEDCASDCTH